MANSKVENNPDWFVIIEDYSKLITELESTLAQTLAHKRSSPWDFDISNPDIAEQCLGAYQERMKAYFYTRQFDLAIKDANHLLSFEPQHRLALKVKNKIQEKLATPQRTYLGMQEDMFVEEANNSLALDTEEESLSDTGDIEECLLDKRSYPFEEEEKSLKKVCVMQNEAIVIPNLNNPFSLVPHFIPLLLDSYPLVQDAIESLQASHKSLDDLKLFIINWLISYRATASAKFTWERNSYKKKENKTLYQLAQENNLDAIIEQFKDIVQGGVERYPTKLIEKIFLNSVQSNYRTMANFFGMPKVRLLSREPTCAESDYIVNKEVYIYKDFANNQYKCAYNRSDGVYELGLMSNAANAAISTLNQEQFRNQLIRVDQVKYIIKEMCSQEGILPFRVSSSISSPVRPEVLKLALSKMMQSNSIDIDLLEDLIEFNALFTFIPEIELWSNNPDNRYYNLIYYLLVWSIQEKRLDLVLLLTNPPYDYVLKRRDLALLTTIMGTNNLAITDYLLRHFEFYPTRLKDVFWLAYTENNKDYLSYFLTKDNIITLVTEDYELPNFINPNQDPQYIPSDLNIQFILTLLNTGKIKNLKSFLTTCVNNKKFFQPGWEVIQWLMANESANDDYHEPYPDNMIAYAIKNANLPLLSEIKAKGNKIEPKWLTVSLRCNTQVLSIYCLILLAHYCYIDDDMSYADRLSGQNVYNLLPSLLVALSEKADFKHGGIEIQILNTLIYDARFNPTRTLFYEMLTQKNFKPILQVITHYANQLKPEDIHLYQLTNHSDINAVVRSLLKEPSLFGKLHPTAWLDKTAIPGLDSYELRCEIYMRAFYSEYLKLFMFTLIFGSDFFIPNDICRYIWGFAFEDFSRLKETTFCLYNSFLLPDPDIINGNAIKLSVYNYDKTLVNNPLVFFKDKEQPLQRFMPISLQNINWDGTFFGNTPNLTATSRQKLVDIVKENGGHVPDIRKA